MLNARHSRLADSVAVLFAALPAWLTAPEVLFSVYGERGVIDILAFPAASGCLLVIELKTEVVDVNELVGTLDRKHRLALGMAMERGWYAKTVSRWVIVSRSRSNLRRFGAHRAMLHAAFPDDGRTMRAWLRTPGRPVSALSTWSDATPGSTSRSSGPRARGRAPGAERT